MATESQVRFIGEKGTRNLSPRNEALVSSSEINSRELGLPFPKSMFNGNPRNHVPNRSGSAPPCIEGSCAVSDNDAGQRYPSPVGGMDKMSKNGVHIYEEQLRSHPSYVAFYTSNVNLNPRLPPPIASRETRHLAQHACHSVETWGLSTCNEDIGSFPVTLTSLPTQKEDWKDCQLVSQDSSCGSERILSRQFVSSHETRHKSVVDLIQEDFPRTPSPVYSNPTLVASHVSTEEDRANSVACASPSPDSSDAAGKVKLGICASATTGLHSDKSLRTNGSSERRQSIKVTNQNVDQNEGLDFRHNRSNISSADVRHDTADVTVLGPHISDGENQLSILNSQLNNFLPQASSSQVPILQFHGGVPTLSAPSQFFQGQSKILAEMLSDLHINGSVVSHYSAAGYLTSGSPMYSNMQSCVLAPHFNPMGYSVNTLLSPPSIASHPLHAVPITFESPTAASIFGTNGNFPLGVDMQHPYKYYGHMGLVLSPPFSNSLCVPYLQHPQASAYGDLLQYDLANQGYDSQKGNSAHSTDQRRMNARGGNLNISYPMKVGVPISARYGNQTDVGFLVQCPSTPLASPQMLGSPLASSAPAVRRCDNIKLPVSSFKNAGTYPGCQTPRGCERPANPKNSSILEELKSNKSHWFELSDIAGHVFEFSTDQHGSRFIQQKLEGCSSEEKASVFSEVLPRASMLMIDVFGNYVIQKFFEHGDLEQKKELASQLVGNVLRLSLHMYGCRVIQKALEVVDVVQKRALAHELDGHVMRCVQDQNGNHVIQKCIECVPTDDISFIIVTFDGQIATLSMHPYGCRVIQRVLEHCTDKVKTQHIVNEILQSACRLAQDQYGNYVIQHVLEWGSSRERNQIIGKLAGQVVQMSQHKYASNVIEKCLKHGNAAEREFLIEEIVGETEGNDVLLVMMKDKFANFVIQKIIETCNGDQREILLSRIRVHLQALKRYTYGKHIVACVEKLSGEESRVASE